MSTKSVIFLWLLFSTAVAYSDDSWLLESPTSWNKVRDKANNVSFQKDSMVLDGGKTGYWTSRWHTWQTPISAAEIVVDAQLDLFDNQTIETVVAGSAKPFKNRDGVAHDWYGRCMIAIVDDKRWIMALRSGVNHISWSDGDAIHLITSTDEGRSWSKLDRWFDGSPIEGIPYDDGYTHSEPGLYRMPNGDLILQFWRTAYTSGTKQLRSTDQGKTWSVDLDRIQIEGVTGAAGDRAIGTEDFFVDPDNPQDVYMAFQYFHYNTQSGTMLARSRDNGKHYEFLSWIGPLANDREEDSGATFEPAIEYVGQRKIVAILRHASGNRYTWQSVSTDMGRTFSPPVDISAQVSAGVPNGLWQRVRLYKESNPYFQHGNQLDYSRNEGRLWGFGLHSNGGGYTRKPVVYWSDDNGDSWQGPHLLHGSMYPGTDTGYGDLKRRIDGTFVGVAYYASPDSEVADVEQYTFGGERAELTIEADADGDGTPDKRSRPRQIYGGRNTFGETNLLAPRWRLRLRLSTTEGAGSPLIRRVRITPMN